MWFRCERASYTFLGGGVGVKEGGIASLKGSPFQATNVLIKNETAVISSAHSECYLRPSFILFCSIRDGGIQRNTE